MRELKYLKIWLTLGWALVGLVIFLSVTPRAPETLGLDGGDKLLHLFTYTIMMLWFGFIYIPKNFMIPVAKGTDANTLYILRMTESTRILDWFDL